MTTMVCANASLITREVTDTGCQLRSRWMLRARAWAQAQILMPVCCSVYKCYNADVLRQGIFFSKDRTEIITEIQEHPIEYSLVIPPGSSTQSLSGNINVVSLTRGEWMSGCPEGSRSLSLQGLS